MEDAGNTAPAAPAAVSGDNTAEEEISWNSSLACPENAGSAGGDAVAVHSEAASQVSSQAPAVMTSQMPKGASQSPSTVLLEVAEVDPAVDATIEASCSAHGLTAINVRNILHHILSNDATKNLLMRLERGEDPAAAAEAAASLLGGGSLRRLRSKRFAGLGAGVGIGAGTGTGAGAGTEAGTQEVARGGNVSTTEEELSEDDEYVPDADNNKVRLHEQCALLRLTT